jgi:hypothetical protein
MKKTKLILWILLVFGMASCNTEPDNLILKTDTKVGDWKYDSVSKKTYQSVDTVVLLSPTWGQSFSLASKKGSFVFWTAFGIVFIFFAFMIVYSQYANPSWAPKWLEKWWIHLTFICVVVGFSSIYGNAASVKFDNYKWVNKTEYDKAMKDQGSTKPIWDSLYNANLIQGANSR